MADPARTPDSTVQLVPGVVLGGRYRVGASIGQGATGVVYEAVDLQAGSPVALKLLHEHLRADPRLDRRFAREFRSGSALDHPNIVRVFDHERLEDGPFYLVMELLRGRTLGQVLNQDGPLPFKRWSGIVRQVLDAIGAAHTKGIVHRDLKPGNVMVLDGGQDQVKVCDFGIAKLVRPEGDRDESLTSLSGVGDLCGTPAYMPPEQARGERLDGRADLYSLSVILYQLITGDLPFRAPSTLGVIGLHLSELPQPMSRRRPDLVIAPELERLVLRGMAKRKQDRPADAAEVRGELERLAAQPTDPVRSRSPDDIPPESASIDLPSTLILGSSSVAPPPARREHALRRAAGWAGLLAVVAVVGVLMLQVRAQRPDPPAPPTPTDVSLAQQPPAVPVPAAVSPPASPGPEPSRVPTGHGHGDSTPPGRAAPRARPRPPRAPAPGMTARLAEAEALLRAGDADGACAIANELLGQGRGGQRVPAAVYRLSGKCLMRLGRAEEAKAAYQRYLDLAPDAPDAPFVRGIVGR